MICPAANAKPTKPKRLIRSLMIASLASSLGIALASAAHSQDATGFIGGIAPNARPEGAPVIVQFTPDANWQENAAHGIRVNAVAPGCIRSTRLRTTKEGGYKS